MEVPDGPFRLLTCGPPGERRIREWGRLSFGYLFFGEAKKSDVLPGTPGYQICAAGYAVKGLFDAGRTSKHTPQAQAVKVCSAQAEHQNTRRRHKRLRFARRGPNIKTRAAGTSGYGLLRAGRTSKHPPQAQAVKGFSTSRTHQIHHLSPALNTPPAPPPDSATNTTSPPNNRDATSAPTRAWLRHPVARWRCIAAQSR
ncbi:hypothetical protein WG78_11540 [Amantichitinum ursilacus]|uniref:Uncharacterized protein n=1 Tax=Amantichitinum ursilacus TaxID=857265 RepID=A0A0N0XJB0_9NEIS|nr:hypothetical protein WG78_11540 [Amantichitinum ursilacus]